MKRNNDNDYAKIKRLRDAYNMIPNLVWSALSFFPLTIYCYRYFGLKQILLLSAVSIIPIFFSNSFLNKIQLSDKAIIYRKLAVTAINTIVQNGTFINRFIRKKFPDYKQPPLNKTSAKRLWRQTYFYEKFHLMLFIFFMLTTVYAFIQKQFGWAFLFLVTNLLYNVYPNLLQQYIRVKLKNYNAGRN